MRIGRIQIEPVNDGAGEENASQIMSRFSDPDAWRCHPDHFGPDGQWTFPIGGFLIRSGDQVILVDTGVGPAGSGRYSSGALLDEMRQVGVEPGDVTDVVFTHLHFDHIGWASRNGKPTFPRANYRAHSADWHHFIDGPQQVESAREKLDPIRSQLDLFDGDFRVAPGVAGRWAPGHTPGSSVFIVSSEGKRATLLGDVAHSVVQMEDPDWTVVWDADPLAASQARNRIADEAAHSGDLLVASHFPDLRFGRVTIQEGRRTFVAL